MRKRNNQLMIWLSDEERTQLAERSRVTGYSMSEYVRALIMGFVPREAPSEDLKKVLEELRSIGNALGDISARAKSIGFFNAKDYERDTERLWQALYDIQGSFLPEVLHGNNEDMER